MKKTDSELQRTVSGVCLFLAPLFITLGEILRFRSDESYFWAGLWTLLGLALSMQVVLGLRHLLGVRKPFMATYLCGLALMTILWGAMIITSRLIEWALLSDKAAAAMVDRAIHEKLAVILFLPALIYPICRIVIGLGLWRAKVVPVWIGLLIALGYLLFPVGRVPVIQPIIHASNVLILLAEGWLGWQILTKRALWERDAVVGEMNTPLVLRRSGVGGWRVGRR